jgi:hypothetical protein
MREWAIKLAPALLSNDPADFRQAFSALHWLQRGIEKHRTLGTSAGYLFAKHGDNTFPKWFDTIYVFSVASCMKTQPVEYETHTRRCRMKSMPSIMSLSFKTISATTMGAFSNLADPISRLNLCS